MDYKHLLNNLWDLSLQGNFNETTVVNTIIKEAQNEYTDSR